MKKCLLIFVLFSNCAFSQVDTLSLQKVRFELGLPFDFGFTAGTATKSSRLPEGADILLNNYQWNGYNWQLFSLQTIFYNKCIFEFAYTRDNLGCDGKNAKKEFLASNSNYFIQAAPTYGTNSSTPEGNYEINYFRYGLGWNFKLTRSRYLQPYVFYANGKGKFPNASYAFKDNNSNYFFTNNYSVSAVKSSGYVIGIRYRKYLDAKTAKESARMYAYLGIKLEFAYMDVKGKGTISRADYSALMPTSVTYFDVAKHYNYVTLGVNIGLGWRNKKHKKSLFFYEPPRKNESKK